MSVQSLDYKEFGAYREQLLLGRWCVAAAGLFAIAGVGTLSLRALETTAARDCKSCWEGVLWFTRGLGHGYVEYFLSLGWALVCRE